MKQLFMLLAMLCTAYAYGQTDYEIAQSDCSSAETLPVSGTSEILRLTQSNMTGGGGQSLLNNCDGGPAWHDIWYKFTATSASHDIIFNLGANTSSEGVEAFSGTCGSLVSIGCMMFYQTYSLLQLTSLTPGQTYYLRFYNIASDGMQYGAWTRVAITTPLPNDDCSGALMLAVNGDETASDNWQMFHTLTATESQQECSTSPTNSSDDDVWFKFVATQDRHAVNVRGWGMMGYPVQVFSGSCGALSNEGCKTSGVIVVYDLNPGETYYVRVYSNDAEEQGIFQIAVLNVALNDECEGAETIAVTDKADCSAGTYFDFMRAGVSEASTVCGPTSSVDLWYKFQPGTDNVFSKINGDADADVMLYSGGCASLTCIESFTSEDNNLFAGLNASETYYIRVAGSPSNGRYLCLSKDPGNDDCSDAIEVPVSPYGVLSDATYGNVVGKTNSAPTCNNLSTNYADVWYKFTATAKDIVVSAEPTARVEVMSGSCGSFTTVACGNSGIPVFAQDLSVGTTYYVRIHTASTSEDEFILRVAEMAPNDDCADAIALTPSTTSYVDEAVTFGRIFSTRDLTGCALPGSADDNVWFKFTATDTAHAVLLKDAEFKTLYLEVLSGTCGAMTSLWCNTGTNLEYTSKTFFGLTVGQDYFMRVYTQYDSISGEDHRFSIAVVKPPANDEMSTAIKLTEFTPAGATSRSTYTSHSATKSAETACGATTAQSNHDVWFYFIAQEATHTVKVSSENNFSPDPVDDYRIEAFGTFTSNYGNLSSIDIGCGTNSVTLNGLPVGDTVFVRVFPFTSVGQTSDFKLSISSSQSINEPTGALLLIPNNTFTHRIATSGMTQTLPPTNCRLNDNPDDDVWFKFVATAEPLRVVCDGENTNLGLELFSGTPGSLTFVTCADNILVTPNNLSAGTTYYVRAFSKGTGALTCDVGLFTNPDILADACMDLSCLSTNLVTNPSCEFKGDMKPFHTNGIEFLSTPPGQVATGWYCPTRTSPDCWDASMPWDNWGDAPSDDFYSIRNVPRSGTGNLGFFMQNDSWVEYVSTKLSEPMQVGHYYYVSYYLMQRNDNAVASVGALFTVDSLFHPTQELLPYPPQMVTPQDQQLSARRVWRRICDTVYADKPYRHMTIGMFATVGDDLNEDGDYAFMDDVFVSKINATCMPVSVPESEPLAQHSLNVFPNPATDRITVVSTEFGKDAILNIYNVTGELILQTRQLKQLQQVNLQNLPSGVYMIQVTSKQTSLTEKVVLQR